MTIVQVKTGQEVTMPVHASLAATLATAPNDMTFLLTGFGRPFTANGFGNWFRLACDAAGLPHCFSHGLRKAAARRLAEAGCTPHQIAAITGHSSLDEVERDTKRADRRALAGQAMARLEGETGTTLSNPAAAIVDPRAKGA